MLQPVETEWGSFKEDIWYMSQTGRLTMKGCKKTGRSPKWPEEGGDSGRPSRLSQPQVSTKPSSSRLQPVFLFLPSRGTKNPREYLPQDKSLLRWPRMSIKSNKTALLSAKSSVSLSQEEKKQRPERHCLEIPIQNLNYRIIKTLHFLMKRLRSSQTYMAWAKSELEKLYSEY